MVGQLATDRLLDLYRDLLLTRLQDIGLKRWVRQGVISKAWLGVGEEAVTVGCVAALNRGRDVVIPMIRNAGASHMMGLPLVHGFTSYLATADSPSAGRDFHYGDIARGVIQPVSHMGTSRAGRGRRGPGLQEPRRGPDRAHLGGDGATRTAACHEGLVVASRLGVPRDRRDSEQQVALGTRVDQHGAGRPEDIPAAHGIAPAHLRRQQRARPLRGHHPGQETVRARATARRARRGDLPHGGHATHDEREARGTSRPSSSNTGAAAIRSAYSRRTCWKKVSPPPRSPPWRPPRPKRSKVPPRKPSHRATTCRRPEHAPLPESPRAGVLHGLEARLRWMAGRNRIDAMFENLRRAFREGR